MRPRTPGAGRGGGDHDPLPVVLRAHEDAHAASRLLVRVALYTKLVESCWRHWKIVSYVVAGDPTLAQMFLSWLVIADQGISVEDYRWPSKVIELKGHTVSNQAGEVNTRECLEYLTGAADPKKILANPLIRNYKDLWWKVASADAPVDLFDTST